MSNQTESTAASPPPVHERPVQYKPGLYNRRPCCGNPAYLPHTSDCQKRGL